MASPTPVSESPPARWATLPAWKAAPAASGPASITVSMSDVLIAPGATALTTMPKGASSLPSVSVRLATAAFDAV